MYGLLCSQTGTIKYEHILAGKYVLPREKNNYVNYVNLERVAKFACIVGQPCFFIREPVANRIASR